MAAWFAIAAPLLPELMRAAMPLFTRTKPKDNVPEPLAKQISELQFAVSHNADSIKDLAAEMQKTIDALQTAAATVEQKLKLAHSLSIISAAVAVLAMLVSAYAVSA
jgi:hypothetical protein